MVAYQAAKNTRKEKERKVLLKEKDQDIEACEQSRLTLEESIKSAVEKFLIEEGQEYEDSTAKVGQLSWIAMEIRKQVEEIHARQIPSTPLEVLK